MPGKGSVFVEEQTGHAYRFMPLNRTLMHVKTNLAPPVEWLWYWVIRLVEEGVIAHHPMKLCG